MRIIYGFNGFELKKKKKKKKKRGGGGGDAPLKTATNPPRLTFRKNAHNLSGLMVLSSTIFTNQNNLTHLRETKRQSRFRRVAGDRIVLQAQPQSHCRPDRAGNPSLNSIDQPGREKSHSWLRFDSVEFSGTSSLNPAFSPRRRRIVHRPLENPRAWICRTVNRCSVEPVARTPRRTAPTLHARSAVGAASL